MFSIYIVSVFLDLPNPWEAIKSAKEAIKVQLILFVTFNISVLHDHRLLEVDSVLFLHVLNKYKELVKS